MEKASDKENKANRLSSQGKKVFPEKEWHMHKILLVHAVGYLRMTICLTRSGATVTCIIVVYSCIESCHIH